MGPPAQDNLFARSTTNRRCSSESMEYTQEAKNTAILFMLISILRYKLLDMGTVLQIRCTRQQWRTLSAWRIWRGWMQRG